MASQRRNWPRCTSVAADSPSRAFASLAAVLTTLASIPLLSGCGGSSGPPADVPVTRTSLGLPGGIEFADVARERGLDFTWPEQKRPMRTLEAFGCGCAAFDANNDGWQDIVLVADPHPRLFQNTGGGQFRDVTESSGIEAGHDPQTDWIGCAVGDYDGDGLLDVLLTGFHRLALYRNLGAFKFQNVTEEAGLDPANHNHWGASAGFMDLDGDQWLDLVITNYVDFGPWVKQYCEHAGGVRSSCPPKEYLPEQGEIWRNHGRRGFELVPAANGMQQTHGVGLVLAFSDLDADGRMDCFIGNDGVPCDLLHNQGEMKFDNIAEFSGVAASANGLRIAAMGADWADYDRDGLLDLTLTNFQDLCFVLFRNNGDRFFTDRAYGTGLADATRNRLGFGAKWVDFENDGWSDIFFVNGHVYENVSDMPPGNVRYRQPMQLFRNQEAEEFVDLAPAQGEELQRPLVGRGSATLDFDNDGRVDLLAVDYEGPVMLLENRTPRKYHWLKLDLRGKSPNHFAYGARVTAKAGRQSWLAEVSPASSYLSSSDPRIHWGLGDITQLDELKIRWPDGKEQTLQNIKADQILRVEQTP